MYSLWNFRDIWRDVGIVRSSASSWWKGRERVDVVVVAVAVVVEVVVLGRGVCACEGRVEEVDDGWFVAVDEEDEEVVVGEM